MARALTATPTPSPRPQASPTPKPTQSNVAQVPDIFSGLGLEGFDAEQYLGIPAGYQGKTKPRYKVGDELKPATMTPENIANWQHWLVSAGLLVKDFRWGMWDEESKTALAGLYAYANQKGVAAHEAANELRELYEKDNDTAATAREMLKRGGRGGAASVEVKPSMAQLGQAVETLAKKYLGDVELTDAQRAELVGYLDSRYSDAYWQKQQVEGGGEGGAGAAVGELFQSDPRYNVPDWVRQDPFNNAPGGVGLDVPQDIAGRLGGGGAGGHQSVRVVDPEAETEEFLKQRLAPLIGYVDRVAEGGEARERSYQSLRGMVDMVRGGG